MLKRIFSWILILVLTLGLALPAAAAQSSAYELTGWAEPGASGEQPTREPTPYAPDDFTPEKVYGKMIAMKDEYPEGMPYNNDMSYDFQGLVDGVHWTGYGCAAFAFMLSDVVFGTLPVTWVSEFNYDDVRPGDILRINNDSHSVIVLRKFADHVELAEANYNGCVHWGRTLTRAQVLQADYVWTRYPDRPTGFLDVPLDAYYTEPVQWALDLKVTSGVDDRHFAPNQGCTRSQVVTFLWRAAGCPAPASEDSPFTDVTEDSYYADAVAWAVAAGITKGTGDDTFSPDDTCTRGQIVTFLYRFDALQEHEEPAEPVNETPFTDVLPTAYYYESVKWAVERNITKGASETTFAPDDTCTRGHVVTFLYRLLG